MAPSPGRWPVVLPGTPPCGYGVQLFRFLGVSPSTVMRDLQSDPEYQPDENGMVQVGKVMGLDGKLRPSRRVDTSARDERICELCLEGKLVRGIAADAGCSVGTVHRVLKEHGF